MELHVSLTDRTTELRPTGQHIQPVPSSTGIPPRSDGSRHGGVSHAVHPFLAGCLIRLKEDADGLHKKSNIKLCLGGQKEGMEFTFGASGRATLHPSNALLINFSNNSKNESRSRMRSSSATFCSVTVSWLDGCEAALLMASYK